MMAEPGPVYNVETPTTGKLQAPLCPNAFAGIVPTQHGAVIASVAQSSAVRSANPVIYHLATDAGSSAPHARLHRALTLANSVTAELGCHQAPADRYPGLLRQRSQVHLLADRSRCADQAQSGLGRLPAGRNPTRPAAQVPLAEPTPDQPKFCVTLPIPTRSASIITRRRSPMALPTSRAASIPTAPATGSSRDWPWILSGPRWTQTDTGSSTPPRRTNRIPRPLSSLGPVLAAALRDPGNEHSPRHSGTT